MDPDEPCIYKRLRAHLRAPVGPAVGQHSHPMPTTGEERQRLYDVGVSYALDSPPSIIEIKAAYFRYASPATGLGSERQVRLYTGLLGHGTSTF